MAHDRLARFLERDHERIGELGRTLVFDHGRRMPRAAVLLHGLTASPTQFAEFGRLLFARGYNVFVPRLPHHGHDDRLTDALGRLTAEELEDLTRDCVEIARGMGDSVRVVGFSLGGLLAAWAAQFLEIDAAVAVAPFLDLSWLPHRYAGPLATALLRFPNGFFWWDPFKRERQMPAHGYPRYSTHAVAQCLRVARGVFDAARQTAPRAAHVAFVLNASETTVRNRSARRLARAWNAHRPGAASIFLLRDLPPSHDIIEPLRHPDIVERIYPVLLDLVDR